MRRLRPFALAAVLAALVSAAVAQTPASRPHRGAGTVAPKVYQGTLARDAMPGQLHLKNVGGSDGSGLCVFASISHSARYQGLTELADLMDWMRSYPGGGYPEKVDRVIAGRLGVNHGVDYVHIYGPDALPILEKAVTDGYMPCVTYGYGERYGQAIDHMVNLVHLDEYLACVLDNNFPGDEHYEWMTREEFATRFAWGTGGLGEGWAIIFLSGDPQPPEPEANWK